MYRNPLRDKSNEVSEAEKIQKTIWRLIKLSLWGTLVFGTGLGMLVAVWIFSLQW